MNRFLASTVMLTFCLGALAQNSPKQQKSASTKTGLTAEENLKFLAMPEDWKDFSVRMFTDSPEIMKFHLKTSWIPGPDNKGLFRYQLIASPDAAASDPSALPQAESSEKAAAFIRRVSQYVIQLRFSDSDGFIVRKIPVAFATGIGDDGRVDGLKANDAVQMDESEYKTLLYEDSFEITWSLPR